MALYPITCPDPWGRPAAPAGAACDCGTTPCACCGPAPEPQDCRPQSIRCAVKVTLASCMAGLCLPLTTGCTEPGQVKARFRRRGRNQSWLLEYPAWDIDDQRNVCFRWDDKIRQLPVGRYEMEVSENNVRCGVLELAVTARCAVQIATPKIVEYTDTVLQTTRPPGASTMYDAFVGYSRTLCAVLEPGDTRLPLLPADTAALCVLGAALCKPVELVLTDGVNTEIVLFSGCTGGVPLVSRGRSGTISHRFPKGTTLAFSWTVFNTTTAIAGC